MMDDKLEAISQAIASDLAGAIVAQGIVRDELTVTVKASEIVRVVKFLRDDARCEFRSIIDITAVDGPSRENRFDVVYHFLSPTKKEGVRIKVEVDETTPVASIIEVFPVPIGSSARSMISMACCSRSSGHATAAHRLWVRRASAAQDFPLTGFVEVRYDDG